MENCAVCFTLPLVPYLPVRDRGRDWIICFLYSVDVLINNAGISNANHPLDPPQDCPIYEQHFKKIRTK